MKVWKMNGAGNAFAIFDARSTPFAPSADQVRQIANDLKADQVIALERDVARGAILLLKPNVLEIGGRCEEELGDRRGQGLA